MQFGFSLEEMFLFYSLPLPKLGFRAEFIHQNDSINNSNHKNANTHIGPCLLLFSVLWPTSHGSLQEALWLTFVFFMPAQRACNLGLGKSLKSSWKMASFLYLQGTIKGASPRIVLSALTTL